MALVAPAQGVDFRIAGAKDDRGDPCEPMVDDLLLAGVSRSLT